MIKLVRMNLLSIFYSSIAFIVVAISANQYIGYLEQSIGQQNAQHTAVVYANALKLFRSEYSKVVKLVQPHGIRASHDYTKVKGTIPLPATLSIELGNAFGKAPGSEFGVKASLYSPYPFPWRKAEGGIDDPFRRKAWQMLSRFPQTPYVVVEEREEGQLLRYVTSDLMNETCVDCHNKHAESSKTDWQVGELGGVMEVQIPLNRVLEATRPVVSRFSSVIVIMGALFVSGFLLIMFKLRRNALRLENRVAERTRTLYAEVEQREQTEVALRESKDRLDAVIDSTVDAIITIDAQGYIESFNLAAERMFGYTEAGVLGKKVNMLMLEADARQHDTYLKNYNDSGDGRVIGAFRELSGKHKNGNIFPMQLAVSEVVLKERSIFTGIIHDLSDAKQLEMEHRHLNKYLDSILHNLPVGIAILEGPQFRFFRINKIFADFHGLPINMYLGKTLAEVIPVTKTSLIPELTTALESGQAILQREFTLELPNKKNSFRSMLEWHVPIKSSDRQISSIISVVMDISERKQIEDALRFRLKQEQMISEISADLMAAGIDELDQCIEQVLAIIGTACAVDRAYVYQFIEDDKIIYNSHEWCAASIEQQKMRQQKLLLDQQLPWFGQHIRNQRVFNMPDIIALPEEAELEAVHFAAYGIQAVLAMPMVVSNRIIGIIGVDAQLPRHSWNRDDLFVLRMVAEMLAHSLQHRQAEQTMRRIQKLDAIGQLSGGIAHDFNNILGVVMGNLELLGNELADNPKAQRRIENAEKALDRATQLTRQLLGVARREANRSCHININSVLVEMKALIVNSLGERNTVSYCLDDKLWLTDIDPGDLQDALLNLLINARDAMPDGGQLILKTNNYCLDEDYCRLNSGFKPGEYVQVIVTDNGEGMSKQDQQHIFEPFFTTKPQGKGTGLGLAMVFGFVQRSKGSIKVYSELGMGTSFRLYLPRVLAEGQVHEFNDPRLMERPHGDETLLLVDDEPGLIEVSAHNLKKLGYRVVTANDAHQALAQLASEPEIALLFSDVVMPGGMDGCQLAEQASIDYPTLKILLTSGFSEKIQTLHRNDNTSNTLFEFLDKPYNQVILAQRIRSILDR